MRTNQTIFRVILIVVVIIGLWLIVSSINNSITNAMSPLQQANQALQTQVHEFLNPTPTILPDPVTIIHDVRSLARLETIQYNVEKIITAEINQGVLGPLFGDKLLFVAHGTVIAGVDLEKLGSEDLWLENDVLYVRLPQAEVFIATLDNEKSYVYDRETGLLTHGDPNLETTARQVAEQEIYKDAIEDGILEQALVNAEAYLIRLFLSLGYPDVVFAMAK